MMERRKIFIETHGKRIILKVRVADSFFDRMKGLMFVKKLGVNEGMLFVSGAEHKPALWMLNVPIALDMLFADSKGAIVDIIHSAQPWSKAPFRIYVPKRNSMYVLEVRAGFSKRNGIRIGDRMKL